MVVWSSQSSSVNIYYLMVDTLVIKKSTSSHDVCGANTLVVSLFLRGTEVNQAKQPEPVVGCIVTIPPSSPLSNWSNTNLCLPRPASFCVTPTPSSWPPHRNQPQNWPHVPTDTFQPAFRLTSEAVDLPASSTTRTAVAGRDRDRAGGVGSLVASSSDNSTNKHPNAGATETGLKLRRTEAAQGHDNNPRNNSAEIMLLSEIPGICLRDAGRGGDSAQSGGGDGGTVQGAGVRRLPT